MLFWQDPQFGDRMIILMAAFVLVLQITMVAQRWLITNICGVPDARAAELLAESGDSVKVAVVMQKKTLSNAEARKLLDSVRGSLRRALGEEDGR